MSQKQQKPTLAAALADTAGSTRRRPAVVPLRSERTAARREKKTVQESGAGKGVPMAEPEATGYQAPSRSGTAPITGHFPRQVRDQLKILAIEQSSTLHNLMAEAYNDLFSKYGKPEIAPHQSMSVDK